MVCTALVLSLAVLPQAQEERSGPIRHGLLVEESPHYQAHVHYSDPRVPPLVTELCEDAWTRVMEVLGEDPAWEPSQRLQIHLYPDKAAYANVEARLTNGHFRDNESFSHWNTKTAHVSLAPPLGPEASREVVLTGQTREVIAHEAAHLAVYSVLPTYKWHPTWFGEGLAMEIELRVGQERGLIGDPSDHPRFSTNQVRAQRMLSIGRFPRLDQILMDELDNVTFNDRYALWHEFFQVLRADEGRFRHLVSHVASIRGGPDMRANVAAFVRELYGAGELEKALHERIRSLRPHWDQVYRSLEVSGERWLQSAFPTFDSVAWRTRQPAGAYVVSGAAQPLEQDTRMELLLGRSFRGHLAIVLEQGRASLERISRTGSRSRLASFDAPIGAGRETRFRIQVGADVVTLELDGEEVFTHAVEPEELEGPWGLGVRSGGSGFWRQVSGG